MTYHNPNQADEVLPDLPPVTNHIDGPNEYAMPIPPGLMGDIYRYIYASSVKPVEEISMVAAIGLMAGICGRAFHVEGTGLNLYLLLLARSGVGKEAISSGIDKLMGYVTRYIEHNFASHGSGPSVREFIGPGAIASGPALKSQVTDTPCFVSVLNEMASIIERMGDRRSVTGPEKSLKYELTALYHKSGPNLVYRGTRRRKSDESSGDVNSPAVSIVGECTPRAYYRCIDEAMMADGFLPRFLVVTYQWARVPDNHGHAKVDPPSDLLGRLAALACTCARINNHDCSAMRECIMDEDATTYIRRISAFVDEQVNNSEEGSGVGEAWNRAHIKTLRLAALVSVGCVDHSNPSAQLPVVTEEMVQWAWALVYGSTKDTVDRLESGLYGDESSDVHLSEKVLSAIHKYVNGSLNDVRGYIKVQDEITQTLHAQKVMRYDYLARSTRKLSAFKKHPLGANAALDRSIQSLIRRGVLGEVTYTNPQTGKSLGGKLYQYLGEGG